MPHTKRKMKTVLMAGGRGTRIASLVDDVPKPMIPINGKPVLEWEIECLKKQGFTDLILTVSHLSDVIIRYFGDGSGISPSTGKPFGVHIEYYVERVPLGNAGALYEIRDKLTEDFLLLNADVMFDVDFERMIRFHERHGGMATILVHPNDHPYDSSVIVTDTDCCVQKWLNKGEERPEYYENKVNAGIHILSPKLLGDRPDCPKVDLDRHVLKPLAGTGELFAYKSPEYVKDMGTPERYASVSADLATGKLERRNLRYQQKAIFLDRDGTINRYVGFLRHCEEFELLPEAAEAIRLINASDYLAIIVTNQPVIARGEVTVEGLNKIHCKMETELGRAGAYVDALYYCPHHPHKGYENEIPELKIECMCRKPKPGMLLRAAEEYSVNLRESWMIGDSDSDIQAGMAAGCNTIAIQMNNGAQLLSAVKKILNV